MKKYLSAGIVLIIAALSFAFTLQQGPTDPWKPSQVLKPADLAKTLNDPKAAKPVIINVGTMGMIKGAVGTGAANTPEGMTKLKQVAANYNKNQEVVIYCGCCTMQNCPNIRGAFEYLTKAGFKNPKVLGIETGFIEDWSGKGYPVQ